CLGAAVVADLIERRGSECISLRNWSTSPPLHRPHRRPSFASGIDFLLIFSSSQTAETCRFFEIELSKTSRGVARVASNCHRQVTSFSTLHSRPSRPVRHSVDGLSTKPRVARRTRRTSLKAWRISHLL
ncbi:hypothetical protein DOTSEDRAFT_75996, partial [Dothistroma septosporum NZE10]